MHSRIRLAHDHFRNFQERTRERGLTALLIIQAVLIFVVSPLIGMDVLPRILLPIAFAVFVLAILVVTSRSFVVTGLVLIAVALSPAGGFVQADHPSAFTECLSAGGRILALSALCWVIARAVFGGGQVTLHRVQGATVLYLNFALFFFVLYRLLYVLLPHAFAGLPAGEHASGAALLYFSFTTLTTVGYGDITPVHPLVRSLANLESVIGQLYPATLLARLISLEIEHRRSRKTQPD